MNAPSTSMSTAPTLHLDQLVSLLVAEFARDPRGKGVAKLLATYAAAHEDWRAYALFAPDAYTRNLVARHEAFELIVLCWQKDQESPVHNHAGQQCWMAILDGDIEEIQFEEPRDGHHGPLKRTSSRVCARGKVAYIDDDIALHVVRPVPGTAGCSLHLYSRPIETCGVYDADTGVVSQRTMRYHSVRGVPCAT
ncbi:MAG: hypothetical protein RL112_2452 [Planctomycetota bacterium]